METRHITSMEELPEAAAALKLGGLVAVPTETVYGLCANGMDSEAVAALYEVKGRPEVKPLSLMIAGPAEIEKYARDIPPAAYTLAARFWPGPLTLVLPAKSTVPSIVRAGGDTIGLRCPAHKMTLALLDRLRLPLAGPSANPSGKPSPKTAEEVLAYFDGKIDAVVDGGECGIGRESTILDLTVRPFRILREGALSREEIENALLSQLRLIGVTGGTGSGKTTVMRTLCRKGVLGLDCDVIYHELLESSEEMLDAIHERFPACFREGKLDRKMLGTIVFAVPEALADLNAIAHKFVHEEVHRRLRSYVWEGGSVAVIDAIALFESGLAEECVFTVGITAPREKRLRRIMEREGISEDYALSRIEAQPEDAYYEARCDYLLVNDGTMEELEEKCKNLFGI